MYLEKYLSILKKKQPFFLLFFLIYENKKKFLSFNAIPHQENPIYKSNADSFFKKALKYNIKLTFIVASCFFFISNIGKNLFNLKIIFKSFKF